MDMGSHLWVEYVCWQPVYVHVPHDAAFLQQLLSCKAVASAGQPVERHEAVLHSLKNPKDPKKESA